MNTLRVDGEIFELRKKKLQIQKYLDTRGRGLTSAYFTGRRPWRRRRYILRSLLICTDL